VEPAAQAGDDVARQDRRQQAVLEAVLMEDMVCGVDTKDGLPAEEYSVPLVTSTTNRYRMAGGP
jgi:hypothetical protein